MKIELWPTDKPRDYPKNARKWSGKAIEKVAMSLREYGFRQPLVVDTEGIIVIGHLRRAAARHLGLAEVPVHVAEGLSPDKIRGLRLADNRTHEEADWDLELLAEEFGELRATGFELGSTGFSLGEIERILPSSVAGEDDVPPVPEVPVTRPGDLWLMGEHRLLCGDATDAPSVAALRGSERAHVFATDPPYGVSLRLEDNHEASNQTKGIKTRYRHFETIIGDNLDGEALQKFLEAAFRAASQAIRSDAAWYLWHAQLSQGFFAAAAAAAAQLLIHRQIIWVKPHFVFGRGDYHWQHELCFYGWVKGHRPAFHGQHNQTSVWTLTEGGGSIRKDQNHPTQKPVELFRRPLLNHSQPGDWIYDPFLGSGTAVIAAQLTGRRCMGLEISPAYCDVIVARWEKLTGKNATLERRAEAVT